MVGAPALEAKTLFEVLMEKYPDRYEQGQLRTLQRRVKSWRAERGPHKDVVLAQLHRPGEAAQTDFTWATELAVTIAGQLFVHMLCVFVLPYSNESGEVHGYQLARLSRKTIGGNGAKGEPRIGTIAEHNGERGLRSIVGAYD